MNDWSPPNWDWRRNPPTHYNSKTVPVEMVLIGTELPEEYQERIAKTVFRPVPPTPQDH